MKGILYLIIACLLVMGLALAGCPSENGETAVTTKAIPGVTVPATDATPVTTITATTQYTGTVTWAPADDPFEAGTVYTATITLTAKAGYTFTDVAADFFTVSGATTVTNAADSGVVTAEFPAAPGTITIAIVGPMDYIQGEHMKWGAEVAEAEINALPNKVNVGGTPYQIELLIVDSDEIDNPGDAGATVEHAISVLGADFVVGGFRTEAVWDMLDAAADHETIMFIQASATAALIGDTVVADYDRYKYIFRGGVINDVFLLNDTLLMLGMVGGYAQGVLTAQGAVVTTPRVAIFAEELTWADPIVQAIQYQLLPALGWDLTHVARVPDDASATVVATHLAAIEEAQTHIIFTIVSGPVGLTYGIQTGVLETPAISVGINVEAQDPGYWDNTDEGGAYHITLGFLAPNIEQTAVTGPFISAFEAHTGGVFPIYTAASYDTVYGLKAAIEAVGLDTDAMITWFENPANARAGTVGIVAQYPPGLPYPFHQHDLMYGPDWVPAIGVQWIDGDIVAVWPKAEYGAMANQLCLFAPTIDWTDFEYAGTEHFQIPTWMIGQWLAFTP